jgi:hypothetical protein
MTELIQSRNPNASEALAIMRTHGAAFRRQLAAVRGYRIVRIAWIVMVLGLFAASFFATKMHWIPRTSVWVLVPAIFIVAYGLCRLWSHYANRVCAKIYQEALRGECRLRLEADGIVVSGAGTVSSVSWSAIRDIAANKDCITVHLSAIHTMSFPVGTFEGQDVESFAAELMRRWQAHRTPSGAPA